MKTATIVVFLTLGPSLCLAQTVTLTAEGGANILVWHDYSALKEGMQMIAAEVYKTQPQLVAQLLACRTPSGSTAVVTNGGFFSSDVVVVSGRSAGCRGTIDNGNIARTP